MVVRHIFAKQLPEMGLAERDHAAETFLTDRPDEAFCIRVQVRATRGKAHWPDAPAREHGAEVRGEERISVHDEVARGQQKPVLSQNWIVAKLTLLRGSSSSKVRRVFHAAQGDRDLGGRWQP